MNMLVEMKIFVDFVGRLDLCDLTMAAHTFTWANFRDRTTFSRLDHFITSPAFSEFFLDISHFAIDNNIF